MITEMTASTFLVHRDHDHWRLGLVWHQRLGAWLPTGGHQEGNETIEETALREAHEEAGARVRLLPLPLPNAFPHQVLTSPWWIVDVPAAPDNHTPAPHEHRDHVFVGKVDITAPLAPCETEIRWFSQDELASTEGVSEDSRMQGVQVLTYLRTAFSGRQSEEW